jgi:hypothetical protein
MNTSSLFGIKVVRLVAVGTILLSAWLPSRALFADDGAGMKPSKTGVTEKKAAGGDEFSFENSVIFSGTATIINGDKAQFMQRHGADRGFSGGVENFHFKEKLDKDTTFEVDGRGLFDSHDYNLVLQIVRADVGYIKAGYNQFRTWYDGSGGFWPANGQIFQPENQILSLDRGQAWFEVALTVPDIPVLTFRYTHDFREGQKDSTAWGGSRNTAGFGDAGELNFSPSFRNINEQRDIFAGSLKHTIGQTKIEGGLNYELIRNDNSLEELQYPGAVGVSQRYLSQREIVMSDDFSVHGTTETWFNDKVLFATGCSYMTLNSAVQGNRIFGSNYDMPYLRQPAAGLQGTGFIDLDGGSEVRQYVANTSVMFIPFDDLSLAAALRAEREDENGSDTYLNTTRNVSSAFRGDQSENHTTTVNESLEARYTGIQDWVLFASAGWTELGGDAMFNQVQNDNRAVASHVDQVLTQFEQKYTLGANWYPVRQVNLSVQGYHKIQQNGYENRNDTSVFRYPGIFTEQDFTTDNANIRVTVRPTNNLTFVTRYDYQATTVDTRLETLTLQQSGESRSHRVGESATWNALSTLFFQANANYVLNNTVSGADDILGIVQVSKNNYWNTSFVAGWAATQKTDINLEYSYYRADDYYDNQASMSYGSGAEEHSLTLSMAQRLADNVRWTLKYGVFTNQDALYGSHQDYFAQMVYTSVQVGF